MDRGMVEVDTVTLGGASASGSFPGTCMPGGCCSGGMVPLGPGGPAPVA